MDRPAPLVSRGSLSCLAKGDQLPLSLGCRCPLSKDVEIAVVGSNLIEEAFRVVPLIEHRLDPIMRSVNAELNRPFIGLSARVTLHPQIDKRNYHHSNWSVAQSTNCGESSEATTDNDHTRQHRIFHPEVAAQILSINGGSCAFSWNKEQADAARNSKDRAIIKHSSVTDVVP